MKSSFMKKTLGIVLMSCMVIGSLTGCGGGSPSGGASSGAASSGSAETTAAAAATEEGGEKVLTIAWANEYPNFSLDSPSPCPMKALIMQHLMVCESRGADTRTCLAKSVEDMGGRCTRVTLYDNIYDSDGNHITADDAIFSYDTMGNAPATSYMIGYYDHCEKIDDYTFDFFVNSDDHLAAKLTLETTPIVSRKAYEEHNYSEDPVGTGPYVLTEWIHGTSMTFAKNENYWAKDMIDSEQFYAQGPDKIVFQFIGDASQVAIAMENGEIDFCNYLNDADRERMVNEEGFTQYEVPNPYINYLKVNCSENSVCQDVNVRLAINYAIDAEALLAKANDGSGEVPHGFGYSDMYDYQQSWNDQDYFGHDVEKAKEYLAKSGYGPENPVNVKLVVSTMRSDWVDIAPIVQAECAEAGINVTIDQMDNATYSSVVNAADGDWDIAFSLMTCDSVIGMMHFILDQRMLGGTTGYFLVDDKLQELVETAQNEATFSDETVDAVQQYLNELGIGYALYRINDYYVTSDKIADIDGALDALATFQAGAFTLK